LHQESIEGVNCWLRYIEGVNCCKGQRLSTDHSGKATWVGLTY
jgi:hypothetical protein